MQQNQPLRAEQAAPHNISIEDRHFLTASGVKHIVSCDENSAVLETTQGTLQIGGEGLAVSELSVQTGQVKLAGSIEYLQYIARSEKRAGLFGKRGR